MYHVTKTINNKQEEQLAVFVHLSDAKTFVQAKLEWDEKINTVATHYKLYDNKKFLESHDWDPSKSSSGMTSTFNPTPAPTTLRPPGSPPPLIDDED